MPKNTKSDSVKNPPVQRSDVLTSAQIDIPNIPAAAAAEGITNSSAYATNRIGTLSRQEVAAKTLKIKQIARKRGYNLSQFTNDPDALQSALDDFDLTCFSLGLYPLQHLVANWFNTTVSTLLAFISSCDLSEIGEILAAHADYCVSVISETAIISDKPPVFSIYYLKSAHRLYDAAPQTASLCGLDGFGSIKYGRSVTINAGEISQKTEIFTEIESKKTDS